MDVKEVFEAYPKSVEQLLGDKGAGFYIPVYQREYSWPESMVSTLLSDCLLGLTHLVDKSDSIAFIGSVIVIKDNRHETIHPMAIGDLPQGVYLVIDGQQRLTTISILCTVLHDYLRDAQSRIEKKTNEKEYSWLFNQLQILTSDLEETFLIDQRHPKESPELRYYPKVIRAQKDCWSRESKLVEYNSPIGDYLHQYIKHINKPQSRFKYDLGKRNETYKTIYNSSKIIQKELGKIMDGGNDDFSFPTFSSLIASEPIKDVLFNGSIQEGVEELLLKDEPSKDEVLYRRTFRLLTYGSYVLKRIAITEVVVKNEDYAFDMFEALNTTGEPLTAFETFKPEVIRVETLKGWEDSPSFEYVKRIEKLLNQHDRAEAKQRATSELLIPFRLSETGQKLTKKLNDQRKYLRKEYQQLKTLSKQREFVRELSNAADFCNFLWTKNQTQKPALREDVYVEDDDFIKCLGLLKKSKHDITQGLLMRYYSNYINSGNDQKEKSLALLIDATKAITAFYVLWRSSRPTTDGIDSHYRTLMSAGFIDSEGNKISSPLARVKSEEVLSLNELQNSFKYILRVKSKTVKIKDKEEWVKHVSQSPIYNISNHISKFLILAAHNDTTSKSGFLSKGRNKLNELFTAKVFLEDDLTLEHIAPQQPDRNSDDWDWEIYDENTDIPNSLGNLTLLPKVANSSIGNSSWDHKKLFYQAMSAKNDEEISSLIIEAKSKGVELKKGAISTIDESDYLPFVGSVSEMKNFKLETVQKRSKNIAENAWVEISKWLNY